MQSIIVSDARLVVHTVGPMVSIQDAGRPGHLRYGVCASGPMDRFSHACANIALDKHAQHSAIEISLGGLTLECLEGAVTVAVAGADPVIKHNDVRLAPWSVTTLYPTDRLAIQAGLWGSFSYLAFAGELRSSTWLGSAATHSLSGFGGGLLKPGDEIQISSARTLPDREGALPVPDCACAPEHVNVVIGPQDAHFTQESLAEFLVESFTLSTAYDRMGVRLDGPHLVMGDALSIPSEPILRGSVQVSGDGIATVLLADHQTTGGYPKIATMSSLDTDRFVQLRSGQSIRFNALSASEAIVRTRETATVQANYLQTLRQPRGTLEYRLMHQNLIDGVTVG